MVADGWHTRGTQEQQIEDEDPPSCGSASKQFNRKTWPVDQPVPDKDDVGGDVQVRGNISGDFKVR